LAALFLIFLMMYELIFTVQSKSSQTYNKIKLNIQMKCIHRKERMR
jgi:hypothetical protein